MSFYPDTDRASTWVALVMIGFMGVSVLVWVLGRGPRDEAETPSPPPPQAAAPVAGAAEQRGGAAQPSQPVAPPTSAQASLSTSFAQKPTAEGPTPQQNPQQPIQPQPPGPVQPQVATAAAPNAPTAQTAAPTTPVATGPPVVQPAVQPTVAPTTSSASREAGPNASALVRGLRGSGHRVHAALSGQGTSMTLSVSGATLTRDAAVEWLGGSRQELKAAGIRVVSVHSGQGSWTFML